jgi:hypothetical protein
MRAWFIKQARTPKFRRLSLSTCCAKSDETHLHAFILPDCKGHMCMRGTFGLNGTSPTRGLDCVIPICIVHPNNICKENSACNSWGLTPWQLCLAWDLYWDMKYSKHEGKSKARVQERATGGIRKMDALHPRESRIIFRSTDQLADRKEER